jgi:hypothetical protein
VADVGGAYSALAWRLPPPPRKRVFYPERKWRFYGIQESRQETATVASSGRRRVRERQDLHRVSHSIDYSFSRGFGGRCAGRTLRTESTTEESYIAVAPWNSVGRMSSLANLALIVAGFASSSSAICAVVNNSILFILTYNYGYCNIFLKKCRKTIDI